VTLSPGSRFGAYDIVALLGRGGMGEVHRARDPRLKRDIAIKVLPAEWAADPERRRRFRREAELLATLNHPNIGAIYGIEDSDGVSGLLLELVEGPTLADRLAHGPLSSSEAIAIARQIADALDAAHERGIVHRDLKPDNIKVRGDGTVKILDFGLAKAAVVRPGDGGSESAALTENQTRAGAVLGTPRYMSPEQLHGAAVDKRADIWAFGCIVYEMLVGRPAFEGSTVAAVAAAILTVEPGWQRLPSSTPEPVTRLLRRCLEKDPKRRARDIGDVRGELEEVRLAHARPGEATAARPTPTRSWRPATVALAALAAAGIATTLWIRGSSPSSGGGGTALVVRQLTSYGGGETNGAVSPDGRAFVFVSSHGGTPDIWLRQVAGGEPVRLTDDPLPEQELAFAPDGESVYFTRTEGGVPAVWQTGLLGGQPRKVIDRAHAAAPAPDGRRLAFFVPELTAGPGETLVVSGVDGADRQEVAARVPAFPPLRPAWSPDGRSISYIRAGLFAAQNLFVVDVATGEERQVTRYERPLEGIGQHQWLPNGRQLVAAYAPRAMALANLDVGVLDLRSGDVERLTASASESFGTPSLSRDGTRLIATSTRTVREVWKVPLSSPDPEVNGGAVTRLLDATADPMWTFVTRDGRTMLYAGTASGNRELWTMPLDRSSAPRQITSFSGDGIAHSSLSPDGTRVAFVSFVGGTSNIWVQNVDGSNPRRLTADAAPDSWPVWSPDGDRIVYTSAATSSPETRVMSADGSSNEKLLDGFFRGDWIRRPNGEGTLIVTSLTGPRSGVRLIDPERHSVVWEQDIAGMGFSLPMFDSDGRRISAAIQMSADRTDIVVFDTDTGALRTLASLPFSIAFRANWVDGEEALIVNRVETTSHVVLFDGISSR